MIPAVTKIYYYIGDAWIEAVDVLQSPPPTWEYGIEGCGPTDLLASTGFANFYLDNSAANSHGTAAYYSIGLLGLPVMIITGDYDYELLLHFDDDADDESIAKLTPSTETGGIIYPAHITPAIGTGCVQLAEAKTNQVLNPSAEAAGNYLALGAAVVARQSFNHMVGDLAYHVTTTIAVGDGIKFTLNALADDIHYVTIRSKTMLPDWRWTLDNAAHYDMPLIGVEDGWYLYGQEFPAVEANGSVALRLKHNAASIVEEWFDGVQVELGTYPTPYCDGSLGTGHSWSGAAHASTSSRTATNLKYDINDLSMKGTLAFKAMPIYEETEQAGWMSIMNLSDGTVNNQLNLGLNPDANAYYWNYIGNGAGRSLYYAGTDFVRLEWVDIVVTWDIAEDELKIYADGVQIGATQTGLTAPAAAWDRLWLNTNSGGAARWDGWFDEVRLLRYVLTPEQVAALYTRTVGGVESVKFIGRIAAIRPSAGLFEDPTVEVEAHDWMGYCAGQELGIIPVQETKKANEALTTALAKFPIQPEATDFETGVQTFLLIFDTESPKSTMASFFQKLCRNELGRIYTKGDGTLRFEKQGARALITTPEFELDGIMTEFVVSYEWADIYNIVQALITPVEASLLPDVLLWDEKVAEYFGGVIPSIAAGETLVLNCPFTDPALNTRISAINVVDPIENIEFGSVGDFETNDMIGDLDWSQEIGGNATIVSMKNNHDHIGYLNDLQIYGRALYTYGNQTLESRDQASIDSGIGERRFFLRLEEIADVETALAFAVMVRDAYSDPFLRAGRINFLANQNHELLVDAINIEPSTRFTAIEEVTTISKDFYVNRVKYTSRGQWLWVDVLADPVRT